MAGERYLIVNADDYGQSRGVNRGIVRAHEEGIVTSASLMVRWPEAVDAARYGRGHPRLSVGIHIDLGEWVYRDDTWVPLYEVVDLEDVTAVRREVLRQLAAFRDLMGREPTHIDSHQHVHRREPVTSVLVDAARELGAPLRDHTPGVHHSGDFYGQTAEGFPLPENITVESLIEILRGLRPGVTELGCHPGDGDDLDTAYRSERMQEVKVLCEPRVREVLGELGILLRSF